MLILYRCLENACSTLIFKNIHSFSYPYTTLPLVFTSLLHWCWNLAMWLALAQNVWSLCTFPLEYGLSLVWFGQRNAGRNHGKPLSTLSLNKCCSHLPLGLLPLLWEDMLVSLRVQSGWETCETDLTQDSKLNQAHPKFADPDQPTDAWNENSWDQHNGSKWSEDT